MRQVLHSGRSSARAILAAATLLWLLPAGCGDDAGKPNLSPTVTLTEFPDPSTPVTLSARFAWTGSDPDGEIVTYEVSLDAESQYTAATDTFIVLTFGKGRHRVSSPHVFRVRWTIGRCGTPPPGTSRPIPSPAFGGFAARRAPGTRGSDPVDRRRQSSTIIGTSTRT
jgi:hypothetical protein